MFLTWLSWPTKKIKSNSTTERSINASAQEPCVCDNSGQRVQGHYRLFTIISLCIVSIRIVVNFCSCLIGLRRFKEPPFVIIISFGK